MDQQLQKFIDSMQTLSDIRNLGPSNPVVVRLEHPVTATRFIVVASSVEPSGMGIPVNTIWVVLDHMSAHFKKALKLVSLDAPDINNGGLAGFTQTWIEITQYSDIFSSPQTYQNNAGGIPGPPGPQGPPGPPGPQGDTPVVDYDLVVQQVLAALQQAYILEE